MLSEARALARSILSGAPLAKRVPLAHCAMGERVCYKHTEETCVTTNTIPNRTIFIRDNLEVMRGMNSESVDLIYLDPPFNSGQEWSAPVGSKAAGAAFKDAWTLDDVKEEWVDEIEEAAPALHHIIIAAGFTHSESMQGYLTYMAIRLLEMRRILKPTGSVYLHCDSTASHYLKAVMDAVFGRTNFRNEIAWGKYGGHKNTASRTIRFHHSTRFAALLTLLKMRGSTP